MLNLLFGSDARVKILNLFLLHPENSYEIPQITRDLKLTANLVHRELDNFVESGLINVLINKSYYSEDNTEENVVITDNENTKADKGKNKKGQKPKKKEATKIEEKRVFEVNKNYILYPEIKALFIKAQILSSQKFISALEKNFQPKLLVLTGFFTNCPEAQTDILIVGSIKRPSFLKLIAELEKELEREINFTILEEKEFKYRQELMDIFLFNILEGKTITLIDNFSCK